jgi:hypothetical protein
MQDVHEPSDSSAAALQLSALDLALAPDSPGIYAWYAEVNLGPEDWRPRERDGVDMAGSDLLRAVADFARVHQPNPIRLRGAGTYRLDWTGTLRRASIADAEHSDEGTSVQSRLEPLSSHPAVRHLLINLMRAASPVFASPLYIGVATNLRTRLAEHLKNYEEARALLKRTPGEAERLQFEGNAFGTRLAGTGLQLEHLHCWIIPADLASTPDAEAPSASSREVAEAAEWILQRTFLPPLGRR